MAAAKITRHFATVRYGRWGERQVHYRRAGSGPLVVLFHQSPLSSRDVVPAMELWSRHFTCIAPDTPGYGLSDPLGVERAEMKDIAEAAIEFFDALGIEKAAIYGFHTGAMIAASVAQHFPERVTCAVSNGYVILTEQERADIVAHYLPPFAPSWDGSHLAWLWSRMREQTIFFPWYRKGRADRLEFNVPPPEALQAGLLDLLRAGDPYRVGYRAAFTMQSAETLTQMQVPVLITASESDVLSGHLPRIRRKSPNVTVEGAATPAAALELSLAFLRKHPGGKAPARAPVPPVAGRAWNDMLDVPGGQLRLRRNDEGGGRTVIVVHDAAGSSDSVRPLAESFIGRRPVIAIDLPGHGESDNTLPKGKVTVQAYAKVLQQALKALGITEFDFVGVGGGGFVGLELALAEPKKLKKLVLAALPDFPKERQAELRANYAPQITADWYGGHLLHAWHIVRDQGLFFPWYDRTRGGILWTEPQIAPEVVHQRVIELLKAPSMWRAACLAHIGYPVKRRLRELAVPTLIGAPAWAASRAASAVPGKEASAVPSLRLDAELGRWGPQLMAFLGD